MDYPDASGPLYAVLPGEKAQGRTLLACVYEAELEGFGIHTRRHFGGRLETHRFFSREAVHSALFDLWSWRSSEVPGTLDLPYGATPLWAENARTVEITYAGPNAYKKKRRSKVDISALSAGVMEAMAPGTRLVGVVWGDADALPPISEGRTFWIGKGRAPARIVRATVEIVEISIGRIAGPSIPVQIERSLYGSSVIAGLAYRRLAEAPHYLVARLAPGSMIAHFALDGHIVPALDCAVRFAQERGSFSL